jgi:2-polyprenyl-3-methyl-5-hydroxy-6-metoxy-1,4-benzoquinol methylase
MQKIMIENLPFYWRLAQKHEKKNNPVKDTYPFFFAYDQTNDLLIQKRNPEVLQALEVIYTQDSNIGYLQDTNEIAKPYGKDFINYIDQAINQNPNIQKILEVGCGGCVVLEHLKKKGLNVSGIDSSSFAAVEGKKKGIDVITDFFPSAKVTEKFDLIYHVDVLEHINDPIAFLSRHHDNLHENGLVVVNVPDATESIEIGDISMAMHQHLNYFTEKSLRNTLQNAGFEVVAINKAGYGGSLYGIGRRPSNTESHITSAPLEDDTEYGAFLAKANHVIKKFGEISNNWLSQKNNTVGYYIPLRTLPYIAIHNIHENFRFFDDTHHWHHREFDGINVKIENFSDLKEKPVSHMLVMSLTFGDIIKKKLISEFGNSMEVVTLSELVENTEL